MKLILASLVGFFLLSTAWADPSQIVQQQYFATYSAGAAAVTPPATPTDICELAAASTGTKIPVIRVTHVSLSSTQTTAGINTFYLVKRSTNDSGAQTTLTSVPHDSNQGAATGLVQTYAANPTAGTSIGTVRAIHVLSPAPAGTSYIPPQSWLFDQDLSSSPIILRTGQSLSINFGGAALPTGLSVDCNFEWSEQ